MKSELVSFVFRISSRSWPRASKRARQVTSIRKVPWSDLGQETEWRDVPLSLHVNAGKKSLFLCLTN
jgi:hypothetical protein